MERLVFSFALEKEAKDPQAFSSSDFVLLGTDNSLPAARRHTPHSDGFSATFYGAPFPPPPTT